MRIVGSRRIVSSGLDAVPSNGCIFRLLKSGGSCLNVDSTRASCQLFLGPIDLCKPLRSSSLGPDLKKELHQDRQNSHFRLNNIMTWIFFFEKIR